MLFIFLLHIINGHAQEYDQVELIVKEYPTKFDNLDQLANRINSDFYSNDNKVRALYSWLSQNIGYDSTNDTFNINNYRILYFNKADRERQKRRRKLKRLEKVFETKKAVCIDYSEIFMEVCHKLEIQAKVVLGYSKTIYNYDSKDVQFKNHAWNVVKINNKWQLIDITWASVSVNEKFKHYYNYYYFTNPKEFIFTHFPVQPKWQLLKSTITKDTFFKKPLFFTSYFTDKFKIADFHDGVIHIKNKKVNVYFDTIPENQKLFYKLEDEEYIKPMVYKKTKTGNYVSSIRYRNNKNTSLFIFSGYLPVIAFKIKPSL